MDTCRALGDTGNAQAAGFNCMQSCSSLRLHGAEARYGFWISKQSHQATAISKPRGSLHRAV
jgi:hypothetical protein